MSDWFDAMIYLLGGAVVSAVFVIVYDCKYFKRRRDKWIT